MTEQPTLFEQIDKEQLERAEDFELYLLTRESDQ